MMQLQYFSNLIIFIFAAAVGIGLGDSLPNGFGWIGVIPFLAIWLGLGTLIGNHFDSAARERIQKKSGYGKHAQNMISSKWVNGVRIVERIENGIYRKEIDGVEVERRKA